jgi:hypothetical protein
MRRTPSMAALIVAALLAPAVLSACEKEGSAEKAGKEMDKAAKKAGDKVEQAGDKIKDAVNK